jgi:hypothetical protein
MNGLRSEIPRLAALINLVATYHPRGLKVILGEDPEPTLADLDEILQGISDKKELGVFIDGGRQSQAALDLVCRMGPVSLVIDQAGGWDNIAASAREVKEYEPQAWNLFAESLLWVGRGSRLENEGGHLSRIAMKYKVHTRTVIRWRDEVPRMIARLALQGGLRVLCLCDHGQGQGQGFGGNKAT